MLEQISKNDKKWRNIALKICGNKFDADDLVNQMYLKVYDAFEKRPDMVMLDSYVYRILVNTFILNKKQDRKDKNISDYINYDFTEEHFEIDDEQLKLIEKSKELRYLYRGYLEQSYDKSLRQIAKDNNSNYGYVYRELKKAREHILGADIDKYKNKRNKRNGRTKR